jgi:hypothetical protein
MPPHHRRVEACSGNALAGSPNRDGSLDLIIHLMDEDIVVEDVEESIAVDAGLTKWEDAAGCSLLEKDYRVGAEVWRVHKNDADPFPSRPHAHCIGGRSRFIGCKLHLDTRQLFSSDNKPLDRYLEQDFFDRIIVLVRRKFPISSCRWRHDERRWTTGILSTLAKPVTDLTRGVHIPPL